MSILSFFHFKKTPASKTIPSDEVEHSTRYGTPVAGDVLMLEFGPENSPAIPARYQATVQGVGLRRLVIGPVRPLVPGLPANPFISKHQLIRVSYSRGTALYRFEGHPVPCGKEWALARPKRVMRIERRSYYRMMVETNTYFRQVTDPRDAKIPGRINNLSAGGLLLVTPHALTAGQRIWVALPAGKSGGFVDVAGDVLEALVQSDHGRVIHMARIRYVATGVMAIHPDTREEIVAYIFEQQRLMLRTRKLMQGA
ncbi:MAG: PilZ domain-containing protein [Capsulimonadaceae bacterium]|nr:PilZ domain-containing protein [Capsulimonadaceae bacterium]